MNRLAMQKGLVHSIHILKRMQLHVTRYIAGSPLQCNDLRIGLYKTGLPKWLALHNKQLYEGLVAADPDCIRIILTVTNVARLHLGDGELDSSTIESPSASDQGLEDDIVNCLNSIWGLNLRNKLSHYLEQERWERPHSSTKAGPNGQALGMAHLELLELPDWLSESIHEVGGEQLKNYMDLLTEGLSLVKGKLLKDVSINTFRRISVKPDKALKNRPIAILDYWSQCALRPLHKAIFRWFSVCQQDMTMNQLGIESCIGKWPSYHSLDLSAATDRFPISLQGKILGYLVDKKYAENWCKIMVGMPFSHGNRQIYYKSGQPMGAYSSWAVFALSHHIIVQYSAHTSDKTKWNRFGSFEDYAILGDDIVIGEPLVAKRYKEVMKGLGVELSDAKSHESVKFVEFAKNSWRYYEGRKSFVNVSGVPLNGILNSKSSLYDLSQELTRLIARGTLRVTDVSRSVLLSRFVMSLYNLPNWHRNVNRLAIQIQDWWEVADAYEWVKSFVQVYEETSPKQRHCNHSPLDTARFYTSILLNDVKDRCRSAWVKLSESQGESLLKVRRMREDLCGISETGPSGEYFPTFLATRSLPWKLVIEDQAKRATTLMKKVNRDIASQVFDWEDVFTELSNLRVGDSKTIDARRTSDIIRDIKRRVTASLLPWEKSR
uniref:RNA-dependent RNA polymerase n=1 Tax=Plasmopara viticola lesion associated mitovirus 20 TaxID=2719446 RepID=A0A6G9RTB2_9VIRU|nr:RNA-dependent RNA polymerase [Plasmopara viticola lesion associated mitovirus 20]